MGDSIASPDKYFYTTDKKTITNMVQMAEYLQDCDPKVFSSHVSAQKNDFADWIENVFDLKELALKLRGCSTAKESAQIIEGFMRDLASQQPGTSLQKTVEQEIHQDTTGNPAVNQGKFREYSDEELEKFTSFVKRKKELPSDEKAEYLKTELGELRNIIKDLRRAGKDPYIAELMLRVVDSKIEFFVQTKDPADYAKIVSIMNDAKRELDYCAGQQQEQFADDVIKTMEIQRLAMRKDLTKENTGFAEK